MTARVPDSGPDVRNRDRLIAKLRRDLAGLQKIPAHRRLAEHADERQETVVAMLADLEAGRTLI